MTRFGRESAASRVSPTFEAPRPEPPDEVSEAGKQTWHDVVQAFRPDWFQGCEQLLAAYCGMVRQIAAELSRCSIKEKRCPQLVRLYVSAVGSLISTPPSCE